MIGNSLSDRNAGPAPARPTLRKSLQRIHLIIIIVSMTISGLSLSTLSLIALRNYAENNLELLASTLSFTVQPSVIKGDARTVHEALAEIGSRGSFSYGRVYNRQGELLAGWHASPRQRQNGVERLIARWLFPAPVSVPIIHSGETIGRIWLIGDACNVIEYLYKTFAWLAASLMMTATLASLLSRRMHAGILQALQSITSVTHDVRQRRAFAQRVPAAEIAELDALSHDFNSLLQELEEWQHSIRREHASLAHQASHDALSGLPNRIAFERALQRAFADSERRQRLALLFIDGDRFKEINDTWGHAAGDAIITATAQRLRVQVRKTDMVARLGGDEFAILLHDISGPDQIARVAQHLMNAMKKPLILPDGQSILWSLSIGAALGKSARSAEGLLAQADAAMYHIKSLGGGWYLSPLGQSQPQAEPA
ncbi:diguanylate cyclase domain-containing protein [Mixta intestinalis]|uniref:Putative diguanylate cyclase YfiN n=1 Tax=Mixta intestinalis TaxID=1615494 RepID=A0A6P1Q3W9_9GAMM|nr:diguanylate cyclase [Mixta intestinalis]QHM72747.1 putative diguanylate cyclase YfiN [Mixta intestinalis]